MDKQTSRISNVNPESSVSPRPQWWTDKHSSTWDRVKAALRRDWEQTKADFSSNDSADLNQEIGDTVKQSVGKEPIPPLSVKTRPDDPQDVAKRVEKQIKERGKAQERVIEAQTEAAVVQVKAQGKIASEQQAAQEKVAAEQRKLGEIAADAREAAMKSQRDAQEKIAKQQEKIAEVRSDASQKIAEVQQKAGEKVAEVQQTASEKVAVVRDWNQVEPAIRYGYGARLQYADSPTWDDQLESRLRHEWTQLKNGNTWEDVQPHVRHGWDAAARNSIV